MGNTDADQAVFTRVFRIEGGIPRSGRQTFTTEDFPELVPLLQQFTPITMSSVKVTVTNFPYSKAYGGTWIAFSNNRASSPLSETELICKPSNEKLTIPALYTVRNESLTWEFGNKLASRRFEPSPNGTPGLTLDWYSNASIACIVHLEVRVRIAGKFEEPRQVPPVPSEQQVLPWQAPDTRAATGIVPVFPNPIESTNVPRLYQISLAIREYIVHENNTATARIGWSTNPRASTAENVTPFTAFVVGSTVMARNNAPGILNALASGRASGAQSPTYVYYA